MTVLRLEMRDVNCRRGTVEKRNEFLLNCIVSFSGPTCERRIKNIPFKPLSERMMEEPFWLGLLAVFVVLGILGTGYMLKKHLPDKFDKLITEQGPDGTKTKKGRGGGGGAANGHAGTLLEVSALWIFQEKLQMRSFLTYK